MGSELPYDTATPFLDIFSKEIKSVSQREKTIKLIRMFYYVEIDKISKLDISKQSEMEINNFLTDYYDRYTGIYLKTKDFIKNLNKIK